MPGAGDAMTSASGAAVADPPQGASDAPSSGTGGGDTTSDGGSGMDEKDAKIMFLENKVAMLQGTVEGMITAGQSNLPLVNIEGSTVSTISPVSSSLETVVESPLSERRKGSIKILVSTKAFKNYPIVNEDIFKSNPRLRGMVYEAADLKTNKQLAQFSRSAMKSYINENNRFRSTKQAAILEKYKSKNIIGPATFLDLPCFAA